MQAMVTPKNSNVDSGHFVFCLKLIENNPPIRVLNFYFFYVCLKKFESLMGVFAIFVSDWARYIQQCLQS